MCRRHVVRKLPATGDGGGWLFGDSSANEDGGTPTDRLMATWGRTTDIEFVWASKLDAENKSREEFQGPDHELMPFKGRREGRHPLLWVATATTW